MEAQELRLDNWICDVFDQPRQVTFGTFRYLEEADEEQKKAVCPIPLTEKILLNSGFDNIRGYIQHSTSSILVSAIHSNGEVHLSIGNFPVSVRYVHEIQNLFFSLTKQEIDINL